ncbi:type II toxin-antitoxin system VapC family toxin [Shinella fusca]|uniref:Ribonuclease VapC n=1 Tax=Shinella fusca TaxID=544480 RepID=A0A7W7YRY5_9HYPH|nr:type II toxin-antitoxin system VapC family toxin [Shinella fusca]MBB5041167.1 ribonuclease VapC [Shinella fusca]
MFIDASAIVAMMTNESDAEALSARLIAADSRMTSPMALWEASVAYSRILGLDPQTALREVEAYIRPLEIEVIAIAPTMVAAAVEAYQRFGKGRHPAGLNFGDCFAYACARHLDMPLLFKGDDFSRTDIESV